MDDVTLGMKLSRQAGWNQLEADWRRFIEMEPEGCFVGELEGRAVGTTATCTCRSTAWIAMVLVDFNFRRKGVGTALLKHSICYLEERQVETIRLDATPLGRPVYEKLGFEPDYRLSRFEGIAQPCSRSSAADGAVPETFAEMIEFDKRMTGRERSKMLGRLFEEFPESIRLVRRAGKLEGFITKRPGANAIQIGPCTATPYAGPLLLRDALNRCAGEPVYVDVPLDNAEAMKVVESSGLTIQRSFTRMSRGPKITDRVHASWASSGPEKG